MRDCTNNRWKSLRFHRPPARRLVGSATFLSQLTGKLVDTLNMSPIKLAHSSDKKELTNIAYMSDRCQDGWPGPLPHAARGAEHLHGALLEGQHHRPRLGHDRQEEADPLPQGIEAVNTRIQFRKWAY